MFDVTYDPCTVEYDGDGKYIFSYDSRLDPVDLADELYLFVEEVKRILLENWLISFQRIS